MDRGASELTLLLHEGVHEGVFPGAVAALGTFDGSEQRRILACAGSLVPQGHLTELYSFYDLASLTKAFVSVAALRLAQSGRLDLHVPVERWLPELAGTPGAQGSLELLLSHRAGLSPWGGLFREAGAPPGSAQAKAFMLREAAARTAEPIPGGGSVYSDLGYMLAGEAIARAAGKPLDDVVREEVTEPLGIGHDVLYAATFSAGARARFAEHVAPTEVCSFRERLVCGEVHDENCFAFGGIAGHAGLFGRVEGVLTFGMALLDVLAGRSTWLDQALFRWALRPRPGGGYVVGWDSKSREGSSAGGLFSERSFGHLGFTGTSIWCDPARHLCAVLLSNRVHPTRENIKIRRYRPHFHDQAVRIASGG